jgi:nucleoside-diphosphate-sugar epimerase
VSTEQYTIIFGATGSIGAYTFMHLREHGHRLIAVGRRSGDNGFFDEAGSRYVPVDVSRLEDFNRLPQHGIENIVHCAGSMPSKMNGYDPRGYIDSIVAGTFNVLEYARAVGAKRIVFTHTRADSNHLMGSETPIPDNIVRKFPFTGDHSVYTICKNAAVDLIEHYHHQHGINRFVFRLPTVYAYHPNKYYYVNGEKKNKAYRLIMDRASRGEPLEIWGDPSRRKEILYVKDLAQLLRLALKSEMPGGIYNAGTGTGVTLEEQILGIAEVFNPKGKKSEIIYRPDKPDGRQFIHDISRARAELGYEPVYNYRATLEDIKNEMAKKRFTRLWGGGDE